VKYRYYDLRQLRIQRMLYEEMVAYLLWSRNIDDKNN